MQKFEFNRRALICAALAIGASGCRWRGEPVVTLGGAAVRSDGSMMQALRRSNDHQNLVIALDRSGLSAELEKPGPRTFFAPNDRAFGLIRPKTDEARMNEDTAYLTEVLRGHLVEARVHSEEITGALPGLSGETRLLALNDELLRLTGTAERLRLLDTRNRSANFVFRDAEAANGIIHSIDNVMLPPKNET